MRVLTNGAANAKTRKRAELGFRSVYPNGIRNAILHLSPVDTAIRGRSVCPWAGGCAAVCLSYSGRGQVKGAEVSGRALKRSAIHRARIRRTRFFWRDRTGFLAQLEREIGALERTARKQGKLAAVRLNGTSDLPWETFKLADGRTLPERFPDVQFYDYTKSVQRARSSRFNGTLDGPDGWPSNYHLTYSESEKTPRGAVESLLRIGVGVARVHREFPMVWSAPMVDGTTHDFRFLDPRGSIVMLRALGRAKRDASGFVRD